MPHSETEPTNNDDTMSEPMTNGEKPYSQFFSHLSTYPLVSDSISTFQHNPYGAKALNISQATYSKILPMLSPLSTPYSYISPYLAKADSLADSSLTKAETRFPIVKEDTSVLKDRAVGVATFPFKVLDEGKGYLVSTYERENGAVKGEGVVKFLKVVVSTELAVAMDVWGVVVGYLGTKKEEVKKATNEKM